MIFWGWGMVSKIYYSIVAVLLLLTLVACELFDEGFGDKVDLSKPTASLDDGIDGKDIRGIFTLSGSATDDSSIKSVVVQFKSDAANKIISLPAKIDGKKWSLDIDTTDKTLFTDGKVDFKVIVTDNADKTDEESWKVNIDNTPPVVLITSPDKYDVNGINTGTSYNQKLIVRGDIKDDSVDSVVVTLSNSSGTFYGVINQINPILVTFDTNTQSIVEGQYKLNVVVTDSAGNKNSYFYNSSDTFINNEPFNLEDLSNPKNDLVTSPIRREGIYITINPLSDLPVVTPTSKEKWKTDSPSSFVKDGGVTFSANIKDDDAYNKIVMTIKDRDTDVVLKKGVYEKLHKEEIFSITLSSSNWGPDWDYDIDGIDYTTNEVKNTGVYILELEVTDINGLTMSTSYNYGISSGPPELIVDPIGNKYKNDTFIISGTAKDTNGIDFVKLEFVPSAGVPIVINNACTGNSSEEIFTYTFNKADLPLLEDYTLNIIAQDATGSESVKTVYLHADTENPKPLLSFKTDSTPTDIPTVNGVITVIGTATDNSQTLKTAELSYKKKIESTWIQINTSDLKLYSWSHGFDTTQPGIDDGEVYQLQLKVVDNAGNEGIAVRDFTVDQSTDSPKLVYSSDWKEGATAAEVVPKVLNPVNRVTGGRIQGTITDDDDVDKTSIKISISKEDGTVISNLIPITNPPSTNSKSVDWSHSFGTLPDGIYQYTIQASDYPGSKSGKPYKTVTSAATTFFSVDNEAPLLNVTSDLTGIFSTGLSVDMEVTDGNGVDSVYRIDSSGNQIVEVTNVVGNVYTITYDDSVSDGNNYEYIRATDKYGSFKDYSYQFKYDKVAPTVSIDLVDNVVLNGNTNFVIYATDTSGIKTVSLKLGKNSLDIPLTQSLNWKPSTDIDLSLYMSDSHSEDILTSVSTTVIDSLVVDKISLPNINDGIIGKYYRLNNDNSKVYYFNGAEYVKAESIWKLDLVVSATDNANKVSNNVIKTVLIDEASDKPVLGVSSLKTHVGAGKNYFLGQVISLDISDDDGIDATSIDVSITDSSALVPGPWTSLGLLSSSNGKSVASDYTIPNSGNGVKGDKKLWIRAKDIISGSSVHTITQPIEFTIDREDPVINSLTVKDDNNKVGYINVDSSSIIVSVNVTDDTELDTSEPVLLTFINSSGTPEVLSPTSVTGDDYDFVINQTLFSEAQTLLTISVKDQFSNVNTATETIFKDSSRPELLDANQNPTEFSIVNGEIVLSGETRETGADNSGIEKIELTLKSTASEPDIVKQAVYDIADNSWSLNWDVGQYYSQSYSTNFNLDSIPGLSTIVNLVDIASPEKDNYYKTTSNNKYYLYNGFEFIEVTEIKQLPIEIISHDKAGNKSAPVTRNILIDPLTDLPKIKVENYSLHADAGKNQFENQIIKGILSDDDQINANKIYVYIDDTATVSPPLDISSWTKIPLDSSYNGKVVSLDYNIPGGISSGDKKLWIKAYDTTTPELMHQLINPVEFTIDKSSPVISGMGIKDNPDKEINIDTLSVIVEVTVSDDTLLKGSGLNKEVKLTYKNVSDVTEEVQLTETAVPNVFSASLDISTIPERSTTLTLTAVDQFNNTSSDNISIYKDTVKPVISRSLPVKLENLNGEITISGLVDDYEVSTLSLKQDGVDKTALVTKTPDNKSWSYILDTTTADMFPPQMDGPTDKGKGSVSFTVEAQDRAGNSAEPLLFTLNIDQKKDYPSAVFDMLNKPVKPFGAGNNKVVINHDLNQNVVVGVIPDNAGVTGNIKVKITKDGTILNFIAKTIDSGNPVATVWFLDLSGEESKNNLGVYEVKKIVEPGEWTVELSDDNGALSNETYLGVVNSPDINTFNTATTVLKATLTDDDSIDKDKIDLRLNNQLYITDKPASNSSFIEWPVTISSDGIYYLQMQVEDINSNKLIDDNYSASPIKELIVKDSNKPSIKINKELEGETILGNVVTPASYFPESGYTKKLNFKTVGRAEDGLAISNMKIILTSYDKGSVVIFNEANADETSGINQLSESADKLKKSSDNKKWEWALSSELLPDEYTSKTTSIKYEVTDLLGNSSIKEQQIIIDDKAPTIEITSPTSGSVVNGDIVVSGYGADNGLLTDMKITFGDKGASGTHIVKEEVIPTNEFNNWRYTIDTYNYLQYVSEDKTSRDTESGEILYYEMDITVNGVDAAGNVKEVIHSVKIDPNADRPTVSILSPKPKDGETEIKLAGIIQFMGTARDDDSVSHVLIRVDYDGDGKYESKRDLYDLDGSGDLIKDVFDGSGNLVTKGDNVDDYKEVFEDESQWVRVEVSNGSWFTELNKYSQFTKTNMDNAPIISVPASTFNFGTINLQVKAVDSNAVPVVGLSNTVENILIDEDYPVIREFKVENSTDNTVGTEFIVTGSLTDNDGFNSLDIYFAGDHVKTLTEQVVPTIPDVSAMVSGVYYVKNLGAAGKEAKFKYVHNTLTKYPEGSTALTKMILSVKDNTSPAANESRAVINLGVDNVDPSGVYSGNVEHLGDVNTLISGIADDAGYVSGIDKVIAFFVRRSADGSIKVVNPYNGTEEVSLGADGLPPSATETIGMDSREKFMLVIDNHKEAYGEPDNDAVTESMKYVRGKYEWSAEVDTSRVNDCEIHYIVIDNAGNSRHYNEAKVIIGTDMNGDNSVDPVSETGIYFMSYFARKKLYIKTEINGTTNVKLRNTSDNSIIHDSSSQENTIDVSGLTEGVYTFNLELTKSGQTEPLFSKDLNINIVGSDLAPPKISRFDDVKSSSVISATGHYDEAIRGINNVKQLSGKVTLKGQATDDLLLRDIKVNIKNGSEVIFENVVIAKWVGAKFVGVENAAYGLKGVVNPGDSTFNFSDIEARHKVSFSLEWDTSYIKNTSAGPRVYTGEDISVEFIAEDASSPEPAAGKLSQSNPSQVFDVVPYITSVTRKSSLDTNRTRFGRYPLQQNETDIVVKGFNLSPAATPDSNNWVQIRNTEEGASARIKDITGVTVVAGGLKINLTGVANSGWLRVSVNGIEAINNSNNNAKTYNKIDDGSGIANTLWNDDIYFRVWEVGNSFMNSSNAGFPSMALASNGQLVGAWTDNGTSSLYTATMLATGGQDSDKVQRFQYYDDPKYTDITLYDGSVTSPVIGFLADFVGSGTWPTSGTDTNGGNIALHSEWSTYMTYYNIRLNMYRGEGLWRNKMLNQFQNPRVASYKDGTTRRQHMSYYDRDSSSLKYVLFSETSNRSGTQNVSEDTSWINIDGGTDGDDSRKVNNGAARSTAAGEYLSIDYDENGYPLIMYYDIAKQTLRLAYANKTNPTAIADWKIQSVFDNDDENKEYVGEHVAIKVERTATAAIIHAAARTKTGKLIYLISNDADGADYTFTSKVIDNSGSVGTYLDVSLNGSIPYLSYINNMAYGTVNGLKLAYIDSANGNNWEYEIVPSDVKVIDQRTSIEYKNGSTTWGELAIGYLSNSFEVVYLKEE